MSFHHAPANGQVQFGTLSPVRPAVTVLRANELPEQLPQLFGRHFRACSADGYDHIEILHCSADPEGRVLRGTLFPVGKESDQHPHDAPTIRQYPRQVR